MANSSSSFVSIDKLTGRDNYSEWMFGMKALLELDDLWTVVEGTEVDEKKDKKALSKIILSVDKLNYSHLKTATKAKDAWQNLEKAFEDSGLTRKVGLLRALVTTKLEDCNSVEEYCDTIISTSHKLNAMNFKVDDEWVGTLLLAGLPEEYRPMIMGLESSGTQITGDSIKVKLLQDVKSSSDPKSAGSNAAMYTERGPGKKFTRNKVKCFGCGKMGHYKSQCRAGSSQGNQGDRKKSNNTAFLACLSSQQVNSDAWFLDSCASVHLTKNSDWLMNSNKNSGKIKTASNSDMNIVSKGTVDISVKINGQNKVVPAHEVMYAPEAAVNLLSISKIVQKGHKVIFDKSGARIIDMSNQVVATGFEQNGIYQLSTNNVCKNGGPSVYSCVSEHSSDLWHRRLGHLNRKGMQLLASMSSGLNKINISSEPCISCIEGKQSRKPFHCSMRKSSKILQLVHSDLCGPMEVASIGGCKYIFTLIDDFSRFIFTYFLSEKSQVVEVFQQFKQLVENQTDSKIKMLRTDNGTEYVNKKFKKVLDDSGIIHQTTVRYSPQQNGVSERANRTICEKARSMLSDACLSKEYWGEAVNTAVYLINRSPTKAVLGKTPYEVWNKEKPNLSELKIFGCEAMAHVPDELRKKWDPKSQKLLFMGYGENKKGYRLIDPNTKKIIFSRDVVFFEGKEIEKNTKERKTEIKEDKTIVWPVEIKENEEQNEENSFDQSSEFGSVQNEDSSDFEDVQVEIEEEIADAEPVVTRTGREVHKPQYLRNYEIYATYLDVTESQEDPQTFSEAQKSSEWQDAINYELKSLRNLQTWTVCKLPDNKYAIDTRWVFRTKEDGTKKARLVAKGFQIQEENDFTPMYAPVARLSTIRAFLVHALQQNWNVRQLDIPSAFLNGKLESEVYIKIPDGLNEDRNKVLKLNRALYGLKESPKCWNNKFNEIMKDLDFERSQYDFCLYTKEDVWLIVFVDDLIITGDKNKVQDVVNNLKNKLNAKDLGEIRRFIGMEISRTSETLSITQKKYINKILQDFGMADCKGVSTPMITGFQVEKSEEIIDVPYRKLVGSLMYLACTSRPDILYAVSYLSRYLDKPTPVLWTAGKRILRYLKNTVDTGLMYTRGTEKLVAYSDADWAGDKTDRKSTSGSVVLYAGNPISWFSKKQTCVALSTAEAEYVAGAASAQEVVNLKGIISEFCKIESITLKMDNVSAISMAKSYENSKRGKHIDIKEHFIKDLLSKKVLDVEYVNSENNIADILTKPLCKEKFNNICSLVKIEKC